MKNEKVFKVFKVFNVYVFNVKLIHTYLLTLIPNSMLYIIASKNDILHIYGLALSTFALQISM